MAHHSAWLGSEGSSAVTVTVLTITVLTISGHFRRWHDGFTPSPQL